MTRLEFTRNIISLMYRMMQENEPIIIDYCKRSNEEQNRLFRLNASKCDGYNNISKHQEGKAIDLYFVKNGDLVAPNKGWKAWHDIWENEYHGKKSISWDLCHFE